MVRVISYDQANDLAKWLWDVEELVDRLEEDTNMISSWYSLMNCYSEGFTPAQAVAEVYPS